MSGCVNFLNDVRINYINVSLMLSSDAKFLRCYCPPSNSRVTRLRDSCHAFISVFLGYGFSIFSTASTPKFFKNEREKFLFSIVLHNIADERLCIINIYLWT